MSTHCPRCQLIDRLMADELVKYRGMSKVKVATELGQSVVADARAKAEVLAELSEAIRVHDAGAAPDQGSDQ